VFSLIFAVYFLLDTDNIKSYWGRVLRLSADEEKRAVLQRLASDGNRVFSGYIRGQFIDALVVGVLAGVTMSLFGVPYAVVVGLLTGLGNLIPYMGTIVGYGSLALACLAAGDVKKFIVGAICLALVMVLDGNVINPRLLSQNIQVHPLLVVASLIAGGAIGGVVGMLVAVPVGAFLKLQLDHYLDRREEKLRAREAAEGPAPQDSERENP
jgi:predicted PurR-regulated permease PerM